MAAFSNCFSHSANQITHLDNREIQNKNKRLQWVLDEGGPLNTETCFDLNYWKTIIVRMAQETKPLVNLQFFFCHMCNSCIAQRTYCGVHDLCIVRWWQLSLILYWLHQEVTEFHIKIFLRLLLTIIYTLKLLQKCSSTVSYTHLTLPTICSV